MSKPSRITLGILGTIVVLSLATAGVMSTPWFRRVLQNRITSAIEEMTGARVEIREFRFHPLALQVILHGLVLHGTEPPGTPPLFYARTLVVRLKPSNLIHREIRRLASLDWDGAEMHLQVKADGSTNLPGPIVRYTAGQAMDLLVDLHIGRVTLAHSVFFWNNHPFNLDLTTRDLAMLLRLRHGSSYEGSFSASAVANRTPGHTPLSLTFSTRFVLSRNELAVTSATWQSPGMSGQGSFNFHPAPEPQGYFSFQTNFDAAALNSVFPLRGLRSGALHAEGQGIYQHGEVSGQGRIAGRQLQFRNPQFSAGPIEASADCSLKGSKAAISNLTVRGWEGELGGEGEIDAGGPVPQFHIRARLRNMSLAALLRSSATQPLPVAKLHPASILGGETDFKWSGEFEKLRAEFDLRFSASPAGPPGTTPVSGGMRGVLETSPSLTLRLSDLNLDTPNSSLRAAGTLAEPAPGNRSPSDLEIQWKTSQFEEWRSTFEALVESTEHWPLALKSQAAFTGEIGGTLRNPEIRGSLHMGAFRYRDWTWDGLAATLVAKPDFLQVSSGRLVHGTSVFDLEAAVGLDKWQVTKTSRVRLSAMAKRTPLEGFKSILGINYPLAGQVSGRLDAAGTLLNLEGTGKITVENGTFAGEPFDSLSTGVRISKSTWEMDTIELLKGPGRMTGKARVEFPARSVTCQLHGTGFALAKFKTLSESYSSLSEQLGGHASFELEGSGTPDNFRFHSTVLVEDIAAADTQIGSLRVELDSDGRRLRIQGTGSGPGGLFSVSGDGKAGGEWPFELQGQYASFRLDPWARMLVNGSLTSEVVAGGNFKASGSLRNASAIEAQSDLQTLEVRFPALKWRNEYPIELRYAANRLTARPFRMQGPSTNLVIEGSLGFAGRGSMSLTAQGTADATLLNVFDPSLQTSGHSRIKLSISGPASKPQMNGAVEIEDVSLTYQGLPFRLSNLNGEIQLEGERGSIKSLRGVSGGGAVTLSGFFTLTSQPRIDVRAALNQVRVRYPSAFISILDGNLRLIGTPDRSQLHGEIVLRQVLSGETKSWLAQFMQAGNPFEESEPHTASPLAEAVHLNVHITSPTPVRLETQDMRLTADVDVRMQGSMANPVPVGTIHFLSGDAIFRGNRFTLNRGDLNLTNPFRTQAALDLEAQTRVQRYNLTVDVTGPLGRLKMAYRSDPPLPSEDVISLLTLGYSQQQQQASTSGLVSSFTRSNSMQSVGTSALLSQALSSQMTGRIQRLFGVSRIKIDPNVGLPGISSGARVTVEQRVTRDLTLTYVTNTASSQYRIIQFEWNVGDNLSLIGVRDQNGIVGVELRFRQRFK